MGILRVDANSFRTWGFTLWEKNTFDLLKLTFWPYSTEIINDWFNGQAWIRDAIPNITRSSAKKQCERFGPLADSQICFQLELIMASWFFAIMYSRHRLKREGGQGFTLPDTSWRVKRFGGTTTMYDGHGAIRDTRHNQINPQLWKVKIVQHFSDKVPLRDSYKPSPNPT